MQIFFTRPSTEQETAQKTIENKWQKSLVIIITSLHNICELTKIFPQNKNKYLAGIWTDSSVKSCESLLDIKNFQWLNAGREWS